MKKSKRKPGKSQEAVASPWRNRIVGNAQVPPQDLIANDKNFRLHPLAQRRALDGAIQEIGFLRSVTVNKRTPRIIDGHLRVQLALEQQQAPSPWNTWI
jgi:hypothetical protein